MILPAAANIDNKTPRTLNSAALCTQCLNKSNIKAVLLSIYVINKGNVLTPLLSSFPSNNLLTRVKVGYMEGAAKYIIGW